MTDLTRMTAAELGRAVGAGEVSAIEVTQAHLDRIAAVNPKINAIVTLISEAALTGADGAQGATGADGAQGYTCAHGATGPQGAAEEGRQEHERPQRHAGGDVHVAAWRRRPASSPPRVRPTNSASMSSSPSMR